jgi:hypothetical protein
MRMRHISTLILIIILAFLLNPSCKSTQETTERILTIILSEGVSGTPTGGTYFHEDGDQVIYSYSLLAGYTDLVVTLDDTEIASDGTITIEDNHTLRVSATRQTSSGEFSLLVTHGPGITGTPEPGLYDYQANDQVNYDYQLESGYTNLEVTLNGDQIPSSGTITMTQDHALQAVATKEYPILGSWTLEEYYNDGSSFIVTATFAGTSLSGTVVDSQGGFGTFTMDGSIIEFTIQHPEVRYEYIGSFSDDNTMSGTSKRFLSEDSYIGGTWSATKDNLQ